MCHCRLIILLSFISLTAICTKAQQPFNYTFRHITQEDGLLHNEVYSITQDGKGFIWIASSNGLQRYDGLNFINYTDMLVNPDEGLASGMEMYADKKNKQLWINNSNTIEKMEFAKNRFTPFDPEKLLKDSPSIFTSYRNTNNQEWLLGHNTFYYYDSSLKKYAFVYTNLPPATTNKTSNIAIDSGNINTWVANYTNLYLFDKKNRRVLSSTKNPEYHPLLQSIFTNGKKPFIRSVMIDSRRNIWVTTWGDILYKYDDRTKKVNTWFLSAIKIKEEGIKASTAGLLINCLFEDNNHFIWAGTSKMGLLRYNTEKNNFDYCIAEKKNSEGIRYSYEIYNLFQDKEQNIWASTDKGISIFNPYRQYFKTVRHEENNTASINKSEIQSFIQTANGDIFIGTWGGGIAVYDKQLNFRKSILLSSPIEKNIVWSFMQVDDKTLWIGCQHGYLLIYNIITGGIQTLHPPEMENYTIRCMEKDGRGNVIFGLQSGEIVKWDKQQQKFFACRDTFKIIDPVVTIFIDNTQHCWVSTYEGFKEFDMEKMSFTNTWRLLDNTHTTGISSKNCRGIEEYNDSTILIGTIHGGLNFFNKKTKIFSHLTTADGLPSNTIYALKKDAAGYIWFTTDYGLYKINPADKKIIPYSIEPGLINASFTANKFYPLQDGQWLTFTATEAISFFPNKTEYGENRRPRIEITGFKLFDKPVFIDSLKDAAKPVRLSYKENFFTVEFAALNFSGIQEVNYFYRLAGINKDWVNSGTKRFANYTDLKPGEYVFEVKADTNGTITSFKIIITPPFWKTGWFISIIAFSTLLLSFLFIRGREKSFKAVAAAKLKVQQLNAEQYKSKLEMELIINYFSSSLIGKTTEDDVLWDVAKNLIGRLGFADCMIYLWNADKTKMIQKAGFGPKGSVEEINKQHFDVTPGQGVVGYVMQTREAVLIPDTSKDNRYRPDEMVRLSEITVPIIYNNELIGVIDSEHPEKNFFTSQQQQILTTIAALAADKIKSIEAEQSLQQTNIEMYSMNEQLLKAKLEALQSQMNPHFIFNSLNSIDNLIQTNQKEKATTYLARFAKLIRNVLDSSKNDTVSFQKDYETLELYLQMEQFRSNDKFTYQLAAEDELLNSDYKVLPLIVQPFVENAIHHGLLNKLNEDRKLIVSAILENDYIKYIVIDNGVGRAKAQQLNELNKPEHQSYGIDITKERIQLYNQTGENNNVTITDLFENNEPSGTRVEIRVKIFENN
jgi:ligand-binding sensor domain-containing protein/putative methionine-R-sulfoxide reductase with GAF domain/anti-sigma regulatory factor (Ser/Thr protein kinase)